jgi:6-phosphogluconolactonase (cycloisomerase 2 family)
VSAARFFRRWLSAARFWQKWCGEGRDKVYRPGRRHRLAVEALEDRVLLSTAITPAEQQALVSGLALLDGAAQTVVSQPAFARPLPGLNTPLNSLVRQPGSVGPDLGDFLDISLRDANGRYVAGNLQNAVSQYFAGTGTPTVEGLVATVLQPRLQNVVGNTANQPADTFAASGSELMNQIGNSGPVVDQFFFEINASLTFDRTLPLNLGSQAQQLGVQFDAPVNVDVQSTLNYDETFGLDLSNPAAPGFFLFVNQMTATAAAQVPFNLAQKEPGLGFGIHIPNPVTTGGSPVALNVTGGSLTFNAQADVVPPGTGSNGGNPITPATIAGGTSLTSLLGNPTLSGALDATLPVTGTLPAPANQLGPLTLRVHDSNVFSGTAPDVAFDVGLSPNLQTALSGALTQLDNVGGQVLNFTVNGVNPLNEMLPAIHQSINGLFPGGNGLGSFLKYENTASGYFTSVPAGTSTTANGLDQALLAQGQTVATGQAQGGLADGPLSISGGFDPATDQLLFHLTFNFTKDLGNIPLDTGADVANLGLAFPTSAQVDLLASLNLDAAFGIDLHDYLTNPTQPVPAADTFFQVNTFAAGAHVHDDYLAGDPTDFPGINTPATLGFLTVNVVNGSFDLDATANVTVQKSGGSTKITLADVANTGLAGLVNITPAGTLNVNLPVQGGIGSFQTPTITDPTDPTVPRIEVLSSNLFSGTPALSLLNLSPLLSFTNLGSQDVLAGLTRLGNFLDQFRNSSVFQTQIPFTNGETLGDVLNLGTAFNNLVDQLKTTTDPNAAPTFNSAQQLTSDLAAILNVATSAVNPTYDPAAKELTFHIHWTPAFPQIEVPLNFGVNLGPLGSISSTSTLDINATANVQFTLGIDLVPVSPAVLTSANAQPNAMPIHIPTMGQNADLNKGMTFTLTIDDGAPVTVTVPADATADNTAIFDDANPTDDGTLVGDLQAAVDATDLKGKVVVGHNGNRITFSLADTSTGTTLTLHADAADPIVTVIGFQDGQTAKAPLGDFFVQDASIGGSVSLSANVTATANFGFVQVSIGGGSLSGSGGITLGLKNPDPAAPADQATRVSLRQLAANLGSITSIVAAPAVFGSVSASLGSITVMGGGLGLTVPANATFQALLPGFNPPSGSLPAPVNGQLDSDLNLQVRLGSNAPEIVTVLQSATTGNKTLSDLATDINNNLPADLQGQVQATVAQGKINILPTAAVAKGTRLQVTVFGTTLAVNHLVFPANGQLPADATFSVQLGTTTPVPVTVAAADTSGDNSLSDLAGVIQNAMAAAGLGSTVTATADGNGITFTPAGTAAGGFLTLTNINPVVSFFNLGNLLNFSNLNFSTIIAGLQGVIDNLSNYSVFSFLNANLPIINESPVQLVDYAGAFAQKVAAIASQGAATLQSVTSTIDQTLGLSPGSSAVSLSLDTSEPGHPALKLHLGYTPPSFDHAQAITLDLNSLKSLISDPTVLSALNSVTQLVGVGASANVHVTAGATLSLDLGFDLSNPLKPSAFVYDTTQATLNAEIVGTDLSFTAAVGPLGLYVTGGTAALSADGTTTAGPATFGVTLQNAVDHRHPFTNLLQDFHVGLVGGANITLPVFFPLKTTPLGGMGNNNLSVDIAPHTATIDTNGLTADTLQTALEGLPNIGKGNVEVTDNGNDTFSIEFMGKLRNHKVAPLQVTDPTTGTAELTVETVGSSTANEVQRLSLSGNLSGTFTITFGGLADLLSGGFSAVTVTTPDFSKAFGLGTILSLLQNPGIVVNGFDQFLGTVQDALNSQVLSQAFPLIGNQLQNGANFIQDFRTNVVQALAAKLAQGADDVQVITLGADPTGSTFTLTFDGMTASPLDVNASASAVQTALANLGALGTGNVSVTGPSGGPYRVEFVGNLAHMHVDPLTVADASGNGTVSVVVDGGSLSQDELQTVSLSGDASGTFTLSFDGQATGPINVGAAAGDVQTALVNLPNIGAGNVKVTGSGTTTDPYVVEFQNALMDQHLDLLMASNPTGGGTATVALLADGAGSTTERIQQALFNALGPTSHGGLGILVFDGVSGTPDFRNVGFVLDNDHVEFDLHLKQNLVSVGTGFNFNIGLPGLGLQVNASINLKVGYEVYVGIGISTSRGLYLNTVAKDAKGNEVKDPNGNAIPLFQVFVDASIQGNNANNPNELGTGFLGPLQLDVQAPTDTTKVPADFNGTFAISLKDPTDDGLNELTLSEILAGTKPSQFLSASLSASANVNLHLMLGFGNDMFPSFSTDFHLDWTFTPQTGFKGNVPNVIFGDVSMNLGTFITNFLQPVLTQIHDALQPIAPIVTLLETPIPGISDLLGSPVTLIDLAALFGTSDTATFFEAFNTLEALFNSFANPKTNPNDGGGFVLDFGTFNLTGTDPRVQALANLDPNKLLEPAPEGDVPGQLSEMEQGNNRAGSFTKMLTASHKFTLSLPLLSKQAPEMIFGLLTGKPVDLIQVDMNALTLGFSYTQDFDIFGPIVATLSGSINVSVHFAFGYDTQGIQEVLKDVQAGRNDAGTIAADLADGFYLVADGTPVVSLNGGIAAGVGVDLGIIQGGVAGGLFATVNLALADPSGDGKLRTGELLGLLETNPLCAFTVSGDFEVRLYAWYQLLIGPQHTYDIIPPIVIFSFNVMCGPNGTMAPPLATNDGAGNLTLNIGPNANSMIDGDTPDASANVKVRHISGSPNSADGETVVIQAFGMSQQFTGVHTITGIGGSGDDTIDCEGVQSPTDLEGGGGNDMLTAGDGPATLLGGDGNDTLTGGMGVDLIDGGDGDDSINAGAGAGTITGGGGNNLINDPYNNSTVVENGASNYVLTNALLTFDNNSDKLKGVVNLSLTGAAAGNTLFTVGQWTGTATLIGQGDNNLVASTADDDVVLSDGSLQLLNRAGLAAQNIQDPNQLSGGGAFRAVNSASFALQDIQTALITGGAGDNRFDVSGWHGGGFVDGQGGTDTLVFNRPGYDLTLSDTGLIESNFAGSSGLGLLNLEHAELTGNQAIDVSGWSNTAVLTGGRVVDSGDGNFTLTGNTLTRTGGGTFTLQNVQNVTLAGGPSSNTFTVSQWNGTAILDGQGGSDRYVINLNGTGSGTTTIRDSGTGAGDQDVVIVNGPAGNDALVAGSRALTLVGETVNYTGVEKLTVNGGGGDDSLTVQGDALTLDGASLTNQDMGPASYSYSGIAHLTLQFTDHGNADSDITVRNTTMPTTVSGGAGRDVLTVDRTADPVPRSVTLTATAITGLGTDEIDYSAVQRLLLNLGSGVDQVQVAGTSAGDTVINTGTADDPVTVLAAGLSGPTAVNSADGKHDTLTVVIYGNPLAAGSGASNLANLQFAVGSLVIDNTKQADGSANPFRSDWQVTKDEVSVGGQNLLGTAGAGRTVVNASGATGNTLDVADTNPVPQTVTADGPQVTVQEGQNIVNLPPTGVLGGASLGTTVQITQGLVDGYGDQQTVVSGDGRFVYAAGEDGPVVFARDPATGQLTLRQEPFFFAGDGSGRNAIAITPDLPGQATNVYLARPNAANPSASNLEIYARDPVNGKLLFLGEASIFQNNRSLDNVRVSPDGTLVYVFGNNFVLIYRRDVTTGLLGANPVTALGLSPDTSEQVESVATSGNTLYLLETRGNSTTPALDMYTVDGQGNATLLQQITATTGTAGPNQAVFLNYPTSVAVSPDGNTVLVTSAGTDNSVDTFVRNPGTGQLTEQYVYVEGEVSSPGVTITGLAGASSVRVDVNNNVYVTGALDNALAVFHLNADGTLKPVAGFKDQVGGVTGLGTATSVAVSPDGKSVYVRSGARLDPFTPGSITGENALATFTWVNGTLQFQNAVQENEVQTIQLNDITALQLSPDGKSAYGISPSADAVVGFTRDTTTGALTVQQIILASNPNIIPNTAGHAFLADPDFAASGPNSLAISPDGNTVYVLCPAEKTLMTFNRQSDGTLQFGAAAQAQPEPKAFDALTFDANGNLVASIGPTLFGPGGAGKYFVSGNGLSVLESNGTTTQTFQDGSGGVFGVASPTAIVLSPDGQNLYVASPSDNAVAVFARNTTTGALTFVQTVQNNVAGVRGLGGVSALVVTPDPGGSSAGGFVLAAGTTDNALAVFRRDPATGKLSVVQGLRNGSANATGLVRPDALTLAAGGTMLYVASLGNGILPGGVAAYSLTLIAPPPAAFQVGYSNMAALTVSPGDGGDNVTLRNATIPVTLDLGAGDNGVTIVNTPANGMTTVNLGSGGNTVNLSSTGANSTTLILGPSGTGADDINVFSTGAGSTTTIATGSGDDTILISGNGLGGNVSVDGGDPSTAPGDVLLYNAGTDGNGNKNLTTPRAPTVGTGTITLDDPNGNPLAGKGVVSYTHIESPSIIAAPVPNAGGPYTINEGDTLTLSATAVVPEGGAVTYTWSVNGSTALPLNGATVTIPWSQLALFGIADDGTYPVAVRATDSKGLFGEAQTMLTVKHVNPTITLFGAPTSLVGVEYELVIHADAPGSDAITQITVDWGDGTPAQTYFSTAPAIVTHVYTTANTTPTINVSALDDDTDAAHPYTASTSVQVQTPVPTVFDINGQNTANVATPYTLNLTATGPGSTNLANFIVLWGDGTQSTLDGTATQATHQFATGGNTYTINAATLDQQGNVNPINKNVPVTVGTPTPSTLVLGTNATAGTVQENDQVTLTGSFVDPGSAAPHTVLIDWGSGQTSDTLTLPGGTFTFSAPHRYLQNLAGNAPYTIHVTVTNSQNASTSSSLALVVDNAAPAGVAFTVSPATINENGSVTLTGGSFTDPGTLDTHTVVVNWGDNTSSTIQLAAAVTTFGGLTHQYVKSLPGNAPYTVMAVVTDSGGANGFGTAGVTVDDVVPANVAVQLSSTTLNEGDSTTLTGSFTDPGTLDTHTVLIDWGDHTSSAVSLAAGVFTFSKAHQYLDNLAGQPGGSYQVRVTVEDQNNNVSTPATASVTVQNVAPTATLSSNSPVSEAGPVTVTFSNLFDPSPADTQAGFHYSYALTAAGLATSYTTATAGASTQLTLDEGSTTVFGRIFDKDGGFTDYTTSVTVTDPAVVLTGGFTVRATEGQDSGNQTVATFTDPVPGDAAGEYTATITWGDGQSSAGTVSANADGSFTVQGHHVYAPVGNYQVGASITNAGGVTASTQSSAVVADAALQAVGTSVAAVEGTTTGVVTVATFTDLGGAQPASDYSARIAWGDGGTSAGTVMSINGTLSVQGSHTYAAEGSFPITVSIEDGTGTSSVTATSTATVGEGDVLTASGSSISATAGAGFTGTVATFTDTYQVNPSSDFAATIDWGDGHTSAGTVSGSNGAFTVQGSHTYAAAGNFTVKVQVSDQDGTATASATSTATVAPSDTLSAHGTPVSATEHTSFTGTVATFSDTNLARTAGDFTATITWGDNSTSGGTVSGSNGSFTVQGSHTYAAEGSFAVSVQVNGPASTGSVTATSTATVADADMLTASASAISATAGTSFTGTVATFSDTDHVNPATDFAATIDWGDNSTSAGSVTGSNGSFTVQGSHTYAAAGHFTVKIDINDRDGTASASGTGSATVTAADMLSATGTAVSATEGASFTGTVATFTDTNPASTAGDFTATIDWGDNSTSAGTVSASNGSFTVQGTHTYAAEGSFPVRVRISLTPGSASATASTTATVAEADVLTAAGSDVSATAGISFTGPLATFTDIDRANRAGDFTATIDWGDGTTSAGTVSGAGGSFAVVGSHTYAAPGKFTVKVQVNDADGTASASATSTAAVAHGAPTDVLAGSAAPVATTEAADFTGAVVLLTDTNTMRTAGALTATIDWGDGTTSTGTVAGGNGSFTVLGSHTYGDEGTYAITVQVGAGPASLTLSGQAQVAETLLPPGNPDGPRGTPEERWLSEIYGDLTAQPVTLAFLQKWTKRLHQKHQNRKTVVSGILQDFQHQGLGTNQLLVRLFGPAAAAQFRKPSGARQLANAVSQHFLDQPAFGQLFGLNPRTLNKSGAAITKLLVNLLSSDAYFARTVP